MTESLAHNTLVSLRYEGRACTGTIRGRCHAIASEGKPGGWAYDVLLPTGVMLINVEAEKIVRVVKDERAA